MGETSEKATNAAIAAVDELENVVRILRDNPQDISARGREALSRCRKILTKLEAMEETVQEETEKAQADRWRNYY